MTMASKFGVARSFIGGPVTGRAREGSRNAYRTEQDCPATTN